MSEFKYIVAVQIFGDTRCECPFIFSKMINHDDFFHRLVAILPGQWESRPVSAGFVNISGKCHGKSETLKIGSRKTVDDKLLTMHSYGGGFF